MRNDDVTNDPVPITENLIYLRIGRFSGVWVCPHGVGYADICEECDATRLKSVDL